jgi:glutamine cyclotransferase
MIRGLALLVMIVMMAAPAGAQEASLPAEAPVWGYEVVAEYPHDPEAYTQGLVIVDGVLYEGTGLEGRSSLRRVDLETGEVLQRTEIDDEHFGEGVAVVGDRIYQLTWQTGTCFVYDRETFEPIETFTYETEGWGLTTDGKRLVMSDGTDRIVFRDPETFEETGHIDVRDGDVPVPYLNELEFIDGEIWANVYTTDWIARIDPATGNVTGWIDLTGLLDLPPGSAPVDVLNGIAQDPDTGRIYVTGKLWPTLFEIELVAPR